MATRVTVTKTLTCPPGELTVADLRAFLDNEAGDARVEVKTTHGDRPGELGQTTVMIKGVTK